LRKTKSIVIIIAVILVILASLPLSISQDIRIKLIDISSPFIKISSTVFDSISSFNLWAGDIFKASAENKRLHRKLIRLSAELNNLKETKSENQRLQKLLGIKPSIRYKSISCRIIARNAGTWFKSLIIDRGTKSGIRPNMPVISAEGVIGRTITCGKNASTVLLVTDVNSSIGGIIQNTRTPGLVEGQGTNECIFTYISKKADMPSGSYVVTSGLGAIFPKGLLIGETGKVNMDSQNLYKTAKIKLSADIDRLEEVTVIERPALRIKN